MGKFNPLYDNSIEGFYFITDGIQFTEEETQILDHIGGLFTGSHFSFRGNQDYSKTAIAELNSQAGRNDREEFDKLFGEIEGQIDLELLLTYAQNENPDFFDTLKSNQGNLKELLWSEYTKRAQREDTIHFDTFGAIVNEEANANPDCHLVFITFDHNLLTNNLHSEGLINYHAIGRGFYGFGSAIPIREHGKTEYRYVFTFGLFPVKMMDVPTKKAYASEIFYHEVVGHGIFGLPDHHDKQGGNCVMMTRSSISAAVDTARNRTNEFFCPSCREITRLPY